MQKVSFYIWMCAIFLISFDVKSQNILDDNIKVTAKENNGKCVIYVQGNITPKLQPLIEKAMESFPSNVCSEKERGF